MIAAALTAKPQAVSTGPPKTTPPVRAACASWLAVCRHWAVKNPGDDRVKERAVTGQVQRFGFWGRVSTEDHQDCESSRGWQLSRAWALIEPHGGLIVAEFFDAGQSRSIPPQRRPRARALLAALANPGRGFDAVVVGEPQRAFYGSQFASTFPLFAHYSVPLWVPEVSGPVDPGNEAHELIMMALDPAAGRRAARPWRRPEPELRDDRSRPLQVNGRDRRGPRDGDLRSAISRRHPVAHCGARCRGGRQASPHQAPGAPS